MGGSSTRAGRSRGPKSVSPCGSFDFISVLLVCEKTFNYCHLLNTPCHLLASFPSFISFFPFFSPTFCFSFLDFEFRGIESKEWDSICVASGPLVASVLRDGGFSISLQISSCVSQFVKGILSGPMQNLLDSGKSSYQQGKDHFANAEGKQRRQKRHTFSISSDSEPDVKNRWTPEKCSPNLVIYSTNISQVLHTRGV